MAKIKKGKEEEIIETTVEQVAEEVSVQEVVSDKEKAREEKDAIVDYAKTKSDMEKFVEIEIRKTIESIKEKYKKLENEHKLAYQEFVKVPDLAKIPKAVNYKNEKLYKCEMPIGYHKDILGLIDRISTYYK